MSKKIFKVGQKWLTRDGKDVVTITEVRLRGSYPVNGIRASVSGTLSYTSTGQFYEEGPADLDLMRKVGNATPAPEAPPAKAAKPMLLPTDPAVRKGLPITTGVLDYFPLALAEVALLSKAGNDQHNPGQPLHWDKSKSTDHADTIARHLIDRGARDTDGMRHSAKLAWRALALLQTELEAERADAA